MSDCKFGRFPSAMFLCLGKKRDWRVVNALHIDAGLGKLRSVYGRQKYVELRREEWKHGKPTSASPFTSDPVVNAPTTYLLINSRQLISIQRNFDVAGKQRGGGIVVRAKNRDEKWKMKFFLPIFTRHRIWRGVEIYTWTIFCYTLWNLIKGGFRLEDTSK